MRRWRRFARPKWLAMSAALIAAAIAAPVTYAQLSDTPTEPATPQPELSQTSDQEAAGNGDAAAAARILRAGGWRPEAGSLVVAASSPAQGDVGAYTLWSYNGANGPSQLLIGESDELGGVETDCLGGPVTLRSCGGAVSSKGHALVVGSVAADATAVEVVASDGSVTPAVMGDGVWFARVTFERGGPLPESIVARSGDEVLARIDADSLRSVITDRPPGVEGGAGG